MQNEQLHILRPFCKDEASFQKLLLFLQQETISIADHKKVEQSLKESQQKYRNLLQNVNDAILITDPDTHHIIGCNQIAHDRLGYSEDEMLGLITEQISSPRGIEGLPQIRKALKEKKVLVFETFHKRKDGLEIPVEISSQEIIFDGKPAFLNVCRDITERKIAENLLLRKNDELNSFIYKASHDLKGPLASIEGLISVAKLEVKDPAANRYFDLILRSSKRLHNNLIDLLEVSRIQNLGLKPIRIDLEAEINDLQSSLSHYHFDQTVDFELRIEPHLEFVSDLQLFRSIMQNLLSNAIKYSQNTGRPPRVSLEIRPHNNEVEISIQDNGHGIPEEFRELVFDMFYRADNQTTGTGLGLYIVKSAVEKLKGRLHLESEVDKGTKVTVILPNLSKNPD